jgi:hypothetical protein
MASERTHPLLALAESDLDFVLKFMLASGSLKDMAQLYGVSYPTIRARLDELIGQLRDLSAGRPIDPMAEHLAGLVQKGELVPSAARAILQLHRKEQQRVKET